MITAETRVGTLLDRHPELVEFLAGYHPHFAKLRNRLLRKVMAPRVTLTEAARMAGVDPQTFIDALREAMGEGASAGEAVRCAPDDAPAAPMPSALRAIDETRRVSVDVRADIDRGEEPFARIMAAVKALAADQVLVLRVPFEPVPLYDVLGRRGLAHWAERHAADDWAVWFWRAEPAGPDAMRSARGLDPSGRPGPPASAAGSPADDVRTLDVRGLEPPQPMVLVLERLDTLDAGTTLEVLHDRRPLFLYPQLEARRFTHETDEPAPGVVRIRIRSA